MHCLKLCITFLFLSVYTGSAIAFSPDSVTVSRKAFIFKPDDYAVANTIKICSNADQIPVGYEAELNMPVCDDKLCANVWLKIYWDLAGNFVQFDTLAGKPLTKFDHKRFSKVDYSKLDQILKDRNSVLRILEKADLIDKSIKLKATTVDAVTGATPSTIKNAVVEGAVYSSFTLWHFINGPVKDSIRACTLRNYSGQMASQMLHSGNFETQLFALKQMNPNDYEIQAELLFQVIKQSAPLIRAYIINKLPIPFQDQGKNLKFVSVFPELDGYSKSIFLNRIISDKSTATFLLPMFQSQIRNLDSRQLEQYLSACRRFGIPDFGELLKRLSTDSLIDQIVLRKFLETGNAVKKRE
jgi:hypothetical protein